MNFHSTLSMVHVPALNKITVQPETHVCNVQSIAATNRPKPFLLSMSLSIKNFGWVFFSLVRVAGAFFRWSPLRLHANGKLKKIYSLYRDKMMRSENYGRKCILCSTKYTIHMHTTFFSVCLFVEPFMQHSTDAKCIEMAVIERMSTHNPNH